MNEFKELLDNFSLPCIFTCSSQYGALLAICLIKKYKLQKKSYLIMFTEQHKVIAFFEELYIRLCKDGIQSSIIKKNKLQRIIFLSDVRNAVLQTKIYKDLNCKKNEFLLINFSWNQKIVRYPASMYYIRCKYACFVEEGATQFLTPNENNIYTFLKKLYGNKGEFWNDKKLLKVYVHCKEGYPKYLQSKMKEFSLDDIFEGMDSDEKLNVAKLFGYKGCSNELINTKKPTVIVFTQPLSEDGYITEVEKKGVYKDIVNYYSQYGPVIVKIHPRDKTEYDFDNALIEKNPFPSEIYALVGMKFSYAIGICTSAIMTVEADKKINLNPNYLIDKKRELNMVSLDI